MDSQEYTEQLRKDGRLVYTAVAVAWLGGAWVVGGIGYMFGYEHGWNIGVRECNSAQAKENSRISKPNKLEKALEMK